MIVALNRQNLLDIAVQEHGTAQAAYDIALLNGIPITEVLWPGQTILLSETTNEENDIKNYYKNNGIQVATAYPIMKLHCWGFPYVFPFEFS